MVDRIHEPFPEKTIQLGIDIGFKRQHVSCGKLLSRLKHPIDASCPPGSFPFRAERISISIRRDPAIRGGNNSRRRIVYARQLLKRNVAHPFMSIVASILWKAAIAGGSDGGLFCSL